MLLATQRSVNKYFTSYLHVGVRTFKKKCLSMCTGKVRKCHFLSYPVTRNAIPGLLMHYGSLEEYADGSLIIEMNDACGLAPLYGHKWVHSRVRLTERVSKPPMRRALAGDLWRVIEVPQYCQKIRFS